MAVISFRVNHLKTSGSRGAARVVAYLTREGQYAPKQAAVEYLTRTSQATADRDDLVHQEVANLPAWAHGDAAGFFARAEQHERGGAQRAGRWGTTYQLSLPRELSHEANIQMAREFLATHLQDHPYLWVMHSPSNEEGEEQPHIHVLFSERTNDALERKGPVEYFKQPQGGGCAKDRWFNHRSSVYEIRAAWCDFTNYTLERAGEEARLHPSSLYTRNIDRQPEPKVGPGRDPGAMAARDRIRQQRDDAQEQAVAAEGWALRKAKLGITDVHQVSPQQFLAESRARARGVQPGQWAPGAPSPQAQQQRRVTRVQAHRETERRALETELRLLTRRQQTIHLPRMPRREQEGVGAGLRANLREEEWEHERGTGYGR